MIDLKLTPDGDLDVSAFDLHTVDGADQVAQRLRIKLRTFLGEWFLDTSKGVPWFEEVLGVKPLDLGRVESVLKEQILGTPEVIGLEAFALDYDAPTRAFTVNFTASTPYGPVSATVESPEAP